MLVFMISLSGCSKKEPVVESSVDFGELESTSEEETTEDIFAVADPNIKGYEIRESTSASHATEETREIGFNVPTETTVNTDNLTDEEIAELEVMEETFTHPITGEFFNRNDLNNIYNMQYEAQTLWEPEFDAGRVNKDTVEKYFNYVYEAVDEEARAKTIQEILSPNITVEFKEPESWPLEETDSEENNQSEDEDKIDEAKLESIVNDLENSGNSTAQMYADLLSGKVDTSGGTSTYHSEGEGGLTVGDLSPYTPD